MSKRFDVINRLGLLSKHRFSEIRSVSCLTLFSTGRRFSNHRIRIHRFGDWLCTGIVRNSRSRNSGIIISPHIAYRITSRRDLHFFNLLYKCRICEGSCICPQTGSCFGSFRYYGINTRSCFSFNMACVLRAGTYCCAGIAVSSLRPIVTRTAPAVANGRDRRLFII